MTANTGAEHRCKWLIVPLEVVERELNGKLLICSEAVKRGWGCIVGTNKEILESLNSLPAGAVLVKSVQAHELSYLKRLSKQGHKIICLDEEGLVQNDLHFMVTVRSTQKTLAEVDAFLLWGAEQCGAYDAAYSQFSDKFHVVGNPRIDLWDKKKYHALMAPAVKGIKSQYGDYIIIPTSFGAYNHMMGRDGALHIYKAGNKHSQQHYKFLVGYQNYSKPLFYAFLNIIKPLSDKFPEKAIIIRPHPSENPEVWYKLAKKLKNVHVAFSGGITPWLLGATAVLHCGSTTAVEAHLLERPVISYYPGYNDPEYKLEVPAKISINASKEQEVLDVLQQICDGEDINEKHPEVVAGHDWLKGWADNIGSYESAVKIMDVMEQLNVESVNSTLPKVTINHARWDMITLKSIAWLCLKPLGSIPVVNNILPFKIKLGLRVKEYNKKKTGRLDVTEVQDFMDEIQTINGGSPINAQVLGRNIIALMPPQK